MICSMNRYKNQLTLLAFILIVMGFVFGGDMQRIVFLVATIIAGIPISVRAYQVLRMKMFSIELLVMIAVVGALIIAELTEAAVTGELVPTILYLVVQLLIMGI